MTSITRPLEDPHPTLPCGLCQRCLFPSITLEEFNALAAHGISPVCVECTAVLDERGVRPLDWRTGEVR